MPSKLTSSLQPGLYLISTPIGNLDDISIRAVSVLGKVDRVACEDTRHTRILLERHNIKTRLLPYHEHNAESMRPAIMARLTHGETIALVSDAGTPLISDPGDKLVRKAIAAGLYVSALPGPCAALMALTLSGLPSDRFMFVGFLPSKHQARKKKLNSLVSLDTTIVFFETARRLSACLQDMLDVFGDRDIAIARELTKIHEETIRGALKEVLLNYANKNNLKGELTIVLAPPPKSNSGFSEEFIDTRILQLVENTSARDTVAELSKETGLSKRSLYARLLLLKNTRNNN